MKSFYTPAPLLPPAAPLAAAGLRGYIDYVSQWDLYVSHLKACQVTWKQAKKDEESIVRDASKRGCVVKKTFSLTPTKQTKREVLPTGELAERVVVVNQVKISRKEVPQAPPVPKSTEAKAATAHAKRLRYRVNRKLRLAKQNAELTKWQLRVKKNQDKLLPVKPRQHKKEPNKEKKGKSPGTVTSRPKATPAPVSAAAQASVEPTKPPSGTSGQSPPAAPAKKKKGKPKGFDTIDSYREWYLARFRDRFGAHIFPPHYHGDFSLLDWRSGGVRKTVVNFIDELRDEVAASEGVEPTALRKGGKIKG